MKRQIKFRGKRTDTGEWIYGDLLTSNGTECEISDWNDVVYSRYDVSPDTVGQFTGLLDKKGREIYEGDILQNAPREVQCKVYWSKDVHAWFVERISYGSKEPLCCLDDKFEVVESIHDNPELLKGGKE